MLNSQEIADKLEHLKQMCNSVNNNKVSYYLHNNTDSGWCGSDIFILAHWIILINTENFDNGKVLTSIMKDANKLYTFLKLKSKTFMIPTLTPNRYTKYTGVL